MLGFPPDYKFVDGVGGKFIEKKTILDAKIEVVANIRRLEQPNIFRSKFWETRL